MSVRQYLLATLLIAASIAPAQAETDLKNTPSGTYQLDPNHTSISFKINHLGFSHYTGRFDRVEGNMDFNSASPEKSTLTVTILPNSIDTNNPKLEEELRGDKWFNVIKFPQATFHATQIKRTSDTTGTITGDFTLMGETHRLTLDTKLIGAGQNPFTKTQALGFSAKASFNRSTFGLTNLLPLVGDEVTLEIETEFDKVQ